MFVAVVVSLSGLNLGHAVMVAVVAEEEIGLCHSSRGG